MSAATNYAGGIVTMWRELGHAVRKHDWPAAGGHRVVALMKDTGGGLYLWRAGAPFVFDMTEACEPWEQDAADLAREQPEGGFGVPQIALDDFLVDTDDCSALHQDVQVVAIYLDGRTYTAGNRLGTAADEYLGQKNGVNHDANCSRWIGVYEDTAGAVRHYDHRNRWDGTSPLDPTQPAFTVRVRS